MKYSQFSTSRTEMVYEIKNICVPKSDTLEDYSVTYYIATCIPHNRVKFHFLVFRRNQRLNKST